MTWRGLSNWAKTRPFTLRLADRLGRSRGSRRLLDRMLAAPAATPAHPDLTAWEGRDLAAVWIGHATVLLRIGGMTILTDPVFTDRIGLGFGLATGGPMRKIAPALGLRELPALDLIIVSHAHYDHLDRPTLARLSRRVPVITSHNNADLIRDLGFRSVTELRWGEWMQAGSLRITARQVQHWGARTFYDDQRGFGAFLIENGRRRALYFGDTGHHELFRDIGKVDLAMIGIGAYDPYVHAHATPEQAWAMADHVKADAILPMHHSTFRLSHEPMDEPMERLIEAAGASAGRLVIRQVGGQWGE